MGTVIPEVLLLGNGLNRCYAGGAWEELIRKISVRDDLPDMTGLTMPLAVILATNGHVREAMKNIRGELGGTEPQGEQLEMLRQLLNAGFSEILTTNYSYEIERAATPGKRLTERRLSEMAAHTAAVERAEPKYMLHTYQRVETGGREQRVWHIHGEARKPESMIIGHYYYAGLLSKMKQYSDRRGGDYQDCVREGRPLPDESWMDAFIMGNVYVLGFRFDPSEFDLWWLLNRKQREKAPHGGVYFYEPSDGSAFNARKELLKVMDVTVLDMEMELSPDEAIRGGQFREFYRAASGDIYDRVKQNGGK